MFDGKITLLSSPLVVTESLWFCSNDSLKGFDSIERYESDIALHTDPRREVMTHLIANVSVQ